MRNQTTNAQSALLSNEKGERDHTVPLPFASWRYAVFGRVLAGFEVVDEELPAFRAFLDELAYPYTPEYENPAYKFFLG